ncbi:MAG: alkaline phosphatase family protein, partial [Candidatus Methylomirabilales bacterium]
ALAPLDSFPIDLMLRGAKFVLSATLMRARARTLGYHTLSLRHLPFRSLPCFDYTLRVPMTASQALGAPTIFDRLSQSRMQWRYLDSSKMGRKGLISAIETLDPSTNFVFVYLHHIDMASHVFGIDSGLFWKTVSRTDRLVGQVVEKVTTRLGDPEVTIFSDHGMSTIRRQVGLPRLLRHPGFPSRFCVALDATMVRLWYLVEDHKLRAEVRGVVSESLPGRFLSQGDLESLHLDFRHRLYGDEIFLVEPGTAIFPNFHSYIRPKAMHAYHPDHPDQHGIVITSPRNATQPVFQAVDIAPLCYRACGIAEPEADAR